VRALGAMYKHSAHLAMLFRVAFCFFLTSQPKKQKAPSKSFVKQTQCNFVDLWANLAHVGSGSLHSVTNSILPYKIQG
jgi:hypothetical protein